MLIEALAQPALRFEIRHIGRPGVIYFATDCAADAAWKLMVKAFMYQTDGFYIYDHRPAIMPEPA